MYFYCHTLNFDWSQCTLSYLEKCLYVDKDVFRVQELFLKVWGDPSRLWSRQHGLKQKWKSVSLGRIIDVLYEKFKNQCFQVCLCMCVCVWQVSLWQTCDKLSCALSLSKPGLTGLSFYPYKLPGVCGLALRPLFNTRPLSVLVTRILMTDYHCYCWMQ